ncbi:MAG: ATP-binding cassette domain-containing protein, partial [Acidimicrobiales bacterium]
MTTPALVARDLRKVYEERMALAGLDLTIPAGQVVALVGHNGSGKSTFLSVAAGLLDATDGELFVSGHEVGSSGARAALSYIPDNPVLYDDLSLLEHLEYVGRLHGEEAWEAKANSLVARLGLSGREDDLPVTFSRGMRQKTMIAIGMIRPFRVLLVDEPFVGLD